MPAPVSRTVDLDAVGSPALGAGSRPGRLSGVNLTALDDTFDEHLLQPLRIAVERRQLVGRPLRRS